MIHEVIVSTGARLIDRTGRTLCDFANTPPAAVALALSLLNENLVEAVVFRPAEPEWVVRFRKASSEQRARFKWYGKHRLEFEMGQVELERWLVFFLKYYRDGVAEVDHLDTEGTNDAGVSHDLTLRVSLAADPVSEEEARRRLGL
jgi:hypothetical protein